MEDVIETVWGWPLTGHQRYSALASREKRVNKVTKRNQPVRQERRSLPTPLRHQVIIMLLWSGTLPPLPLVFVLTVTSTVCGLDSESYKPRFNNAQGVNLWKLLHQRVVGTAGTSAGTDASEQWYAGLAAGAHGRTQTSVPAPPPVSACRTCSTRDPTEFHAETFTQPLDHFGNSTNETFPQRFWVNKRHYRPRPGAPVIVIDGGETSGEGRLPFLDTGIADILAGATGGVGVVLEHRYYGA
jgi:hypothetical protein